MTHSMKRNCWRLLLALGALGALLVLPRAAQAGPKPGALAVSPGAENTAWVWDNATNTLTIKTAGQTVTSGGTPLTDVCIVVEASVGTLTLDNLNITAPDGANNNNGRPALDAGGNLEITVSNTVTLTGGKGGHNIMAGNPGGAGVKAASALGFGGGTLYAYGGVGGDNWGTINAGDGGYGIQASGNISNSAIVYAVGGDSFTKGGTGIEGNVVSNSGTITAFGGIRGNGIIGNVTSTDGSITATGGAGWAGISGSVTASGAAQVEATGGDGGDATGIGTGGAGGAGIRGTVTASGAAQVEATGGDGGDATGTGAGGAGGAGIHLSGSMQLYGGAVTAVGGTGGTGTTAGTGGAAVNQNGQTILFSLQAATPAVLKLTDEESTNYSITKDATLADYYFTVDDVQQPAGNLSYTTKTVQTQATITLKQQAYTQQTDSGPTLFFLRRTLTDKQTGVTVTGSMTSYARLTVQERALHAEGACPACEEIRARQAAGELIILYDISISGGYTGALEVSIPVGEQYNGQTVTILHCKNGVLESVTCVVQNGVATGTFKRLSPFAVVKGANVGVPENTVVDPPKTGDAPTGGMTGVALVLCALGVLVLTRKKSIRHPER